MLVLDSARLAAAIRANPFPQAQQNHEALHLYFLAGRPKSPDFGSLAGLAAGREAFRLEGGVGYLWTPDGSADSVLRSRLERCRGVPATARNWRTANEVLKLMSQVAEQAPRG